MERVLVLGASGFIGTPLTASLASSGASVTAVGRHFNSAPAFPSITQKAMDLHSCSQEELQSLVGEARVIYHLVWTTFASTAEQAPARDLVDNVGFFIRLLDCLKYTSTILVFCSSGGTVYGRSPREPIAEEHALQPITAYGAGKVAAETYADTYRRAYGLDVRIARLANPYGLGQDLERPQGALTRFAARAARRETIEVWGDGSIVRDYVHIDDAVKALVRIGQGPQEAFAERAVLNVGSGRGASLRTLIDLIAVELGEPLRVTYTPARSTDVDWNVLDVSEIGRRLGWRPTTSLSVGIQRMLGQYGRRLAC